MVLPDSAQSNQLARREHEESLNAKRVTIVGGGGGGSGASPGRTSIALLRNDYTGTNVTTGAYVQLTASTSDTINQVNIFDSSGQALYLAVGPAASEVNQIFIIPGGNGTMELLIPSGSRISVKAVSATASVGELLISCLK